MPVRTKSPKKAEPIIRSAALSGKSGGFSGESDLTWANNFWQSILSGSSLDRIPRNS